jgi:AcrR family transcriptional regulator
MSNKKEMKEKILDATIKIFNTKGLKFTMDDIAEELSMSKKTIYTVFRDKDTLFLDMVDYCFDRVKSSQNAIISRPDLGTLEKLRGILAVLPEGYENIDFSKIYTLKTKYPKIYDKVEERIETGWENTYLLINKGIEEGCIRSFHIPIFKTMFESTLERFFQRDTLIANRLTYTEALNEVADIMFEGIVAKN